MHLLALTPREAKTDADLREEASQLAQVLERTSTKRFSPAPTTVRRRWFVLWFSVPMALLAIPASLLGILNDGVYARETPNWAAQAVAQDIVNLIAFPALVIFAVAAAKGSVRAYLAWLGVLGYCAYTYAIYSFAMHFGPLFLVHVAVFGLSVYALVYGLTSIDFERVKESFPASAPARFAAVFLLAMGTFFYLLWLSSVIPAAVAGDVPEEIQDAGLLTNPVHVLDMALFLPAMLIAGSLLLRKRPLGYVLAPLVLATAFTISLGIIAIQPVLAARGQDPSWAVAGSIAFVAAIELATLIRLLHAVPR